MLLIDQIKKISESPLYRHEIAVKFLARAERGNLTRDDREPSHFVVHAVPYDPATKQVFIIHHRKSNLWLSPFGHINRRELLFEALTRTMREQLGFAYDPPIELEPFLLTMTSIEDRIRPCSRHYEIWYAIPTDGSDFHVDLQEFHAAKWVSIVEARARVRDPANLQAINKIEAIVAEAPAV
jgi:8-oxo-dGTP pyrophosphatase MutT (NUDIX family)